MKHRKKLFLHIGLPKTGSSAIQDLLSTNRKSLMSDGVLYPISGDTAYAGHAGIAFAAKMKAKNPFKILIKEINESSCKKIVVSSEYFFTLKEQKIEFLFNQLKDFDVKVIVYLRRQDDRIESGYLQILRDTDFRFSGNIEDYIQFLKKHPERTDYFKLLETWSKFFSEDAIEALVYEEHKGKKMLIPGFLETIEHPAKTNMIFSENKKNVTYKPILNYMLRKINALPIPKKIYLLILSFFNLLTRYLLGPGTISEHNLLSSERRKIIMEECEESNKKVAVKYLGRKNGSMFGKKIKKNSSQ